MARALLPLALFATAGSVALAQQCAVPLRVSAPAVAAAASAAVASTTVIDAAAAYPDDNWLRRSPEFPARGFD